ncbi:HIT family protein [Candidatus Woesearchaeota archaeon]|nr:HIT family protein [Candidatus Woesearchaeota archaeon]
MGEIACAKIYEDKNIFIFLDIMPAGKGHTLVIPKNHYLTLSDIPDETVCQMMMAAKRVAKSLSLAVGNKAYNVLMNNGRYAGQAVEHAHLHIMPRFRNDNTGLKWNHSSYKEGEIEELADRIRKFV